MVGSLEGGCDPGFPGSQLLSSNPDSACGKPLHAVRGKGSNFSVDQELNLLGNFRIFHLTVACWAFQLGCLLDLYCEAVRPLIPQPSQPTSLRASLGTLWLSPAAGCSSRRVVAGGSAAHFGWARDGWADDVPSVAARAVA